MAAVEVAFEEGEKGGGLIATEATIMSGAYPAAVRALDKKVQVVGRACPLLVPLIEEGREEGDLIVGLALREYLAPFLEMDVSAMILGCTHYPIFAGAIQETLGAGVTLIDSARQTARVVGEKLDAMKRAGGAGGRKGRLTCYVTDQGQRFERLATRFSGGAGGDAGVGDTGDAEGR